MKINKDKALPEIAVEIEGAKDVKKTVLIGPDDGSNRIVMRLFKVLPGGYTPHHRHDFEHVVKVMSGRGIVVDEKGIEHELLPEQSLFVPPDEEHQFRNPFGEPFEFLCIIPGQ